MPKSSAIPITLFAAGLIFLGSSGASAQAPQTPAGNSSKTTPPPAASPAPAQNQSSSPSPFTTDKEKESYALGVNIGSNLKRQSVDVDPTILAQGIKDAMTGGKPLLTEDEAKAALTQLQTETNAKLQAARKELADANLKASEEFLASNKTKEGVVTLPSGLQYKILAEGTGPKPTADDSVVCNYRGTLVDGSEFDSSYKRGQPLTIPVGHVIKGWTEALQLMPVGSKWQLFIPPDLAYGPNGAGNMIGPNATLIFEVELLSIKPKEASPAPGGPATTAPQAAPKPAQPATTPPPTH